MKCLPAYHRHDLWGMEAFSLCDAAAALASVAFRPRATHLFQCLDAIILPSRFQQCKTLGRNLRKFSTFRTLIATQASPCIASIQLLCSSLLSLLSNPLKQSGGAPERAASCSRRWRTNYGSRCPSAAFSLILPGRKGIAGPKSTLVSAWLQRAEVAFCV